MAKEACEEGVSVAKLAQSHGLNVNMVFKWRREYRAGLLLGAAETEGPRLIPVAFPVETAVSAQAEAGNPSRPEVRSALTIELNGARVHIEGAVDPNQLRLVLRCLMPA